MRKIVARLTLALMFAVAGWPAAGHAHLAAHTPSASHAGEDGGHAGPAAPASEHGGNLGHCLSGACWSFTTPILQVLHPELTAIRRDLGLDAERLRSLSIERDPPVPRRV